MTRAWSFVENPFLNSTRTSYRKMKKLGDYTLAALEARAGTAFFDDLIVLQQPLVTAFNAAYNTWLVSLGTQKGMTEKVKILLKQLSGELIRNWDVAIQNVYAQTTSQYTALLPNRRKPFQTGSKQQRKAAVQALGTAIGADAALATVKTEIDTFYAALTAADNDQQGSVSASGGNSDGVEAQRILLSTGMYSILGALMIKYKTTPEQIENFFDLETLRSKEQDLFTGDVDVAATELVCLRTLQATDNIRLQNAGDSLLRFAIVAEENDAIGARFVEVPANDETIVTASALGAVPANRFLIVNNRSEVVVGEWEVEMV